MYSSLDQWHFSHLSCHITVTLLWKCWRWNKTDHFDLLSEPEVTVINMVITVQWAESLPCGKQPGYSRHLPSSGLRPPTLKTKSETKYFNVQISCRHQESLFQKRVWGEHDEFVQKHKFLSMVAPGRQLAKSFLDQFVNSQSCKKVLGVRPVGSAAAPFY